MLEIKKLTKKFKQIQVLNELDLNLNKGEILSILGKSGSGKSTLLRIIANLEKPSSYEKFQCLGQVALMFQNYALFPHLNVKQNILFALHDLKKEERDKKLNELLEKFEISKLKDKNIDEISGGQAQRVAFVRAVARGCDLLLLDEPFSNLDQALKNDLRKELKLLIKEQGICAILVTHDIADAYYMSDKIALLSEGKIMDVNTPKELYFHPKDKKSAKILTDLNIIEGKLDLDDEFFAWIESRNRIFGFAELKLGTKFEARVMSKEFLGAFYKLKLDYKGICFYMLLSSSYDIKEKICFDFICK